MKIVIAGGTGQIGQILVRAFAESGHATVVLSRSGASESVRWDGKTLGDWAEQLDGADVVINLAGRTVNCRYTKENLRQMIDSRVDSTRVVGQAIAQATNPPAVWLQMSTATIYAHRFDANNDEATGIIGGEEPDAPGYWRRSIEIAQAWERTLDEADTPNTRKVALRTAMVMSPDRGGVFDVLSKMTRLRLGGPIGGGKQYVSWIHQVDLVNAIRFLIEHDELSGAVNLSSPGPLPQRDFMQQLRDALSIRLGLPATAWMAEIGAFFLRTDTELLLKSRRVTPGRLLDAGFQFRFPNWADTANDLVSAARVS
ncbi:MAG: TIGR01777 family oxidoreductase [Pirellulaceae bacterium]